MTSRAEMIEWAVSLLRAGILASNIPGRLMEKYGLTPAQARDIAQAALKHKRAAAGGAPDREGGPG